MILFLDACVLIYRVEEVVPWNAHLTKLLATFAENIPVYNSPLAA